MKDTTRRRRVGFLALCLGLLSGSVQAAGWLKPDFETGAPSPGRILRLFREDPPAIPGVPQKRDLPPAPWERDGRRGDSQYGGYVIEEFYRAEAELLDWDRRYRDAPSGSWDERIADRRRHEAFDRGMALLSRFQDDRYVPSQELERFAQESDRKYQAARSGSLIESLYAEARTKAWQAFRRRAQEELSQERDWRYVVREAARFEQRYQAARSGSQEESAFRELRDFAWRQAYDALERELRYDRQDFRNLESMGEQFDREYQAARSGSPAEDFYNKARRLAFDSAFQEVEAYVSYHRWDGTLYSMEREYDSRYREARSGSPAESYYQRVRDLIRRNLEHPRYPWPSQPSR